jgi:segregation and condensation protein B
MPDDKPNEPEAKEQPVAEEAPSDVTLVTDLDATVNLTGDLDATVNLTGDSPFFELRDDRLTQPSAASDVTRTHLKGLLEALVFASDHPQKAGDLARASSASLKEVRELLADLKVEYQPRGIQLDEVAGGWIFRTSPAYAPFVRDLTKQKPVRLSRAQVETLAILAYRQPVTRPEIDEIRGVDSGPVLKLLLERDLVRILGKKDEPGRPIIYGTTTAFLEFFGLRSLKDLPTLREFTELTEDSRRVAERELGDMLDESQPEAATAASVPPEGESPGET